MRVVSLAIVLFCFWLALSGHYTAMLVSIGVGCAIGVAGFARRMGIADEEGHPIHLAPYAPAYWFWLATEIVKSAWQVTRIILDPALPISPTLTRVKAGQKTPLGVNIYANSITLTPGTISVEVDRHEIVVHALVADGADGVEAGDMDRRVTRFEGRA